MILHIKIHPKACIIQEHNTCVSQEMPLWVFHVQIHFQYCLSQLNGSIVQEHPPMTLIQGNRLKFNWWNAEFLWSSWAMQLLHILYKVCWQIFCWSFGLEEDSHKSHKGHMADVSKPPDLRLLNPKKQLLNMEALTDDEVSHLITECCTSHLIQKLCFSNLYLWSGSFDIY